MKRILTTVLITFSLFSINAQESAITKDPKAKAILEELSKKNKSYSSITADFSYTLKNEAEGINETQKGSLVLKGQKYKLNIAGQEIISDGQTVWTYLSDVNEVQINTAPDPEEEENQMISPTNIFTLYESGFKYKFEKEEQREGKTVQIINLYPEDAGEKPYHTVKLIIEKAKQQINSIEVLSKDGNLYIYKLDTFEPNSDVSDSVFTFDTSKADEVIDLR